ELSLDQLGAHAHAHYKQGEKANNKANDHAKSAGLYLAEAKRRIDAEVPYGERTAAWTDFLAAHCPLKRTRAEQLIAIATGETTVEEARQNTAPRPRSTRERRSSLSLRTNKVHPSLAPPIPRDTERDTVLARVVARLEQLTIDQLLSIERTIPNVTHH